MNIEKFYQKSKKSLQVDDKERNNVSQRAVELDILKGFAIFLVVLGHTYPICREYIYLFHVGVFFMASGFCWNESCVKNRNDYIRYCKKKIKTIYLPYCICNLLFLFCRNIFIKINIYSNNNAFLEATVGYPIVQKLTNPYSLIIMLKETVRIILGVGTTQIAGPTLSDGTLWEGQIALYFRWTCLPDCAVPELDADYRRNNRRLS